MVDQRLYRTWRKVPFARIFLFFGLGLLAGFKLPLPTPFFLLLVGMVFCLLLFLVGMEYWGKKSWCRSLFPPIFYLLLFLSGLIWMARKLPAQQTDYFATSGADYLIAVVRDEPLQGEATRRFPVTVSHVFKNGSMQPASGQLMLYIAHQDTLAEPEIAYGDQLLFRNRVTEVKPPFNPAQFDYKQYLAYQNIYHQAYLQAADVRIIGKEMGNPLVAHALKIRQELVQKFAAYISDKESLEISSALIMGYRANFQPETLAAFVNTGTVHVLSVSGLHVGLVFYLLNFLLRFLGHAAYGRTIRWLLMMGAIWGYVLLTGMAPSILRAGLMISFLLLADWTGRSHQRLNALFASACCLLVADPLMIFDIGFQLSYLAVFGLFTLYPLLNRTVTIRHPWVRIPVQAVLVSVSAQLLTTPLALYYFHQFPNYFLLGNLFVSLPTMALMYVGIALALCPFGAVNVYLGWGLGYLGRWLLGGLQAIDRLPYATVQGVDLSGLALCSFLFAIGFLLIAWYGRHKASLWCMLLAIGVLLSSVASSSIKRMSYRGVKIYNVGYELAIANIDRGRVSLISTFDSLTHRRLRMQVLPDLQRYAPTEDMAFFPIQLQQGQLLQVQTVMGTLGVMTGYKAAGQPAATCDLLVGHRLSRNYPWNTQDMQGMHGIVLTGSNADPVIETVGKIADTLGRPFYSLKNNFAYVWEEE